MADWTYDSQTGTYYDEDGDPVPRKTILALLATLTAGQAQRLRALAQQRADDVLDTPAWHAEMADQVTTGVIAGAALASGGVDQLDKGWTAARVATQLQYLAGFVAAVREGTVPVTQPAEDGQPAEAAPGFLARAELYAGETHSAYMAAENEQAAARGFELERNILDDGADSCAECIDASDQDWVPLGTLSLPGERECMANCLTGETLVQAPGLELGFRRLYSGAILHLRTMRGRRLSITPNHPILTRRGWVAAGLLHEGDYLICGRLAEEVALSDPDVEYMPSLIAEIVDTLAQKGNRRRMPGLDVDFHGDGSDSDIDVVWPNGLLRMHAIPALQQPRYYQLLASANVATTCHGTADHLSVTTRFPADSSMSRGRQGLAFVRRETLHPQGVSLANAASRNAVFYETFTDRATIDAVAQAKGLLRFTSEITLDEIINIERDTFHGDVYNLQTPTGWYISNGIITHNCRCEMDYSTADELEGATA